MIQKIDQETYYDWRWSFYLGKRKTERLGQAFLNDFFQSESNPILFYEIDDKVAEQMVLARYVE